MQATVPHSNDPVDQPRTGGGYDGLRKRHWFAGYSGKRARASRANKVLGRTIPSGASVGARHDGFALVLALVLMAFVLMLVLTLSGLVRVESQASDLAMRRMEARMNARLGALVALGDLQKQLGADARATAPAGASATDGRSRWTGVWDTRNGNLMGWLVSGENADPESGAGEAITLVASENGNATESVEAPVVTIGGSAQSGRFAYWAEGQASAATVHAAPETNRAGDGPPVEQALAPGMQGFEFLLGSGGNGAFTSVFDGSQRREDSAVFNAIGRLSGTEDLNLLPGANGLGPADFEDLTTVSFGIIAATHPEFPGLKHDLSLQPDTSGMGRLSLGPGFEAFANAPEAVVQPSSSRPVVTEESDLRRVYTMQGPSPEIDQVLDGSVHAQDSPAKGTPVFSIHPVLTQFSFRIWPHVTGQDSRTGFDDRDLALLVAPSARFWNPYTSAIDMRDAKLQIEISDLPAMGIEFIDKANNETTRTEFDAEAEFSSPLVLEYEIDNHNRTAPGNQPNRPYLTPDRAYGENLWGPGRVISFTRHSYDDSRDVFRHAANLEPFQFNSDPRFEGASDIVVKLDGKAPPMTDIRPVPPIEFERGFEPPPSDIQNDIFENLRIRFDIPAFQATVDLFAVHADGRREHLQRLRASFPRANQFERRVFDFLPNGRRAGGNYGVPGGSWYAVGGATETSLSYSFRLREATPGVAEHAPSADRWLENDVRWALQHSPALADGLTSRDAYGPTYKSMSVWDSNFDSMFGWKMNDVRNRPQRIYSSLFNRIYHVVSSQSELTGRKKHFVDTTRDVYLFELPRREPLSMGSLQHLQVHGFPPYAIGNSWGQAAGNANDVENNLNLVFDRYFFSGLVPGRSEPRFASATDRPLPHANLFYRNPAPAVFPEAGGSARDQTLLASGRDSSAFLMTKGAFNVNATSVDAWMGALASQRFLDFRHVEADENLWDADHRGADDFVEVEGDHAYFSRFSQTLQELDPSAMPEGRPATGRIEDYKYSLHRLVEDNGDGTFDVTKLRRLAEEIVALLRSEDVSRPFPTLAAFLGPLDPDNPEDGSLIEQAIDAAGLNASNMHRRSPAYLTQADVVSALVPILQTRSDTFRVRAYGSVPGIGGDRAEAWCEMVVQRVVEPVEPLAGDRDTAMEQMREPGGSFGRRFKVVGMRYLEGPEE